MERNITQGNSEQTHSSKTSFFIDRFTRREFLLALPLSTVALWVACWDERDVSVFEGKKIFVFGKRGHETFTIELNELEYEVFLGINIVRAEHRLERLVLDDTLTRVCRTRSMDMILRNYFDHQNPDGKYVFDLLNEAGYPVGWQGENLARNNYTTSETVDVAIKDWMASKGHRENILKAESNRLGVGVFKSSVGMYIYATVFAQHI